MTKRDKLIKKLLSRPKDFRYSELTRILFQLGYIELKTGKTAGSRKAFINEKNKHIIRLHKPHPKDIMKMYQIDYLIQELKKKELI
jgi:hypothetical protein